MVLEKIDINLYYRYDGRGIGQKIIDNFDLTERNNYLEYNFDNRDVTLSDRCSCGTDLLKFNR